MNTIISQALATGLPVISTRHSGIPDQVIEGVNGYLADERDVHAIAHAILHLLEEPQLLETFGKNGRAHVLDHYDDSQLIERQIHYYKDLIYHAKKSF